MSVFLNLFTWIGPFDRNEGFSSQMHENDACEWKRYEQFQQKLEREEVNPVDDAIATKMFEELDSCNSIIEQARERLKD